MAAECQVTKILIGPRNKKARKTYSAVKINDPPFHITSSPFGSKWSHWVHSRKPKFKIRNILLDVGSTSQP
jgi:hypothetical protein